MSTPATVSEKSTTVRSINNSPSRVRPAVKLSRGLAALACRLFPASTAYWIERTVFAPPRARVSPHARKVLANARSFTAGAQGLAAWCWQPDPAGEVAPCRETSTTRPTALLVHGWAGRGSQLTHFVQPLLDQGYRVVTFDAPGHGVSPGKRSSLPIIADAIAEVSAWVGGIDVVVAHSAGAASLTLALDRGLWIRRAALLAPLDDIHSLTYAFLRRQGISEAVIDRVEQRSARWLGMPWSYFRASRRAVERHEPVRIFHDRGDRDVPFSQGERLARAWPDATLRPVQGLGHRGILRAPTVIEEVTSFLRPASTDC